ncbi:hypothetical protein GCM10017783_08030 [Deinococcus piscis]|uniref:Uncharacterized protein n=1 Tax=Deinococcus piscis TaxID=394230 RepID=A0ABQ3K1W1_9DEIO|nr:hypothetical protein GCM10017783_08030 [Deinococcus piscis]
MAHHPRYTTALTTKKPMTAVLTRLLRVSNRGLRGEILPAARGKLAILVTIAGRSQEVVTGLHRARKAHRLKRSAN